MIALLLMVCGTLLYAQAPADKKAAAADAKKAAAPVPAKPAAKPAAKPVEEAEESVVMVDSKPDAEPEEGGRFAAGAYGAEQEETAVPKGIPASYGQCKGVLNEGARSILIFESPDDGEITFVQVTFGKGGVSWKKLDSLKRYGAEAGFN